MGRKIPCSCIDEVYCDEHLEEAENYWAKYFGVPSKGADLVEIGAWKERMRVWMREGENND